MLDIFNMKSIRREILFFALSGVAGFCVDAGIVELLHRSVAMELIPAKLLAFSAAVTCTWLINRHYTFAHRRNGSRLREWLAYVSANSVGGVANNAAYAWAVLCIDWFARYPVLAVALGSLAGLAFNFTASRWLVFRHPR